MPTDIQDLRSTIIPRSDQLNADQLVGGPMIITVTDVRVGGGEDQPVAVFYDTDPARPFKPCKTMRKVLILAWGPDGRKWIGKSMELFNEPSVKFGGEIVGGIRISRLSDIPKEIKVSLTATKGRKTMHEISPLELSGALSAVLAAIGAANDGTGLKRARARAQAELTTKEDLDRAFAAYTKRVEALKEQAAAKTTETVDRSTAQIDPADRPDVGGEDPPPAHQEGAGATNGGAPVATYAQVATALSRASTRDALDEAALLIDAVENAGHRKELRGKYEEQAAALRDGAGREAAA